MIEARTMRASMAVTVPAGDTRMKKVVLVLVLLIAVAAIGLPPIIGRSTENIVRTQIQQMDMNPIFSMRVSEYERGWFTGQARITIALDENYAAALMTDAVNADVEDPATAAAISAQAITIPVELAHGPIILMDGLYFGLSRLHAVLDDRDALAAMVTQELGLDYVAELRGQTSFFGTFSFTGNVPPVEYINESGHVSFSGFEVDGSTRGANLQADGGMDRLVMDAEGNTVTVENMRLSADSMRINQFLWAGDFESDVQRISVVDTLAGARGAIEAVGLKMSGKVDLNESGELFDATMTYEAAQVRVPAEDIELTDAQLTIGLTNLSVEGITQYYETALTLDGQDPRAAAQAMSNIALRLLENNPAIAFDPIRFTLDGESLTAAIIVRTVNAQQGNIDLSNPLVLLGLFEASARLDASKPLVERLAGQAASAQLRTIEPGQLAPGEDLEAMAEGTASMMIVSFLSQGYLVDDGENYSTEIEYANGEIRINGMPLPLGALLQ
jgi:uncharacterized protein YdgA (DUF945 family)